MEELMKSLEGPKQEDQQENKTPKDVNGLLAVHVKALQMVDSEIDPSILELLQLKLSVRGHIKQLPLSSSVEDGQIVCNKVKHFIVELPERNDDPDSYVCVELLINSPLLPGSGSMLGKAIVHLHDIIHESPLSGQCELKDENGATFAVMRADFVFSYGSYGFGESFQLKHSVHKPGDYLHFSTFPRLTPREGRVDLNGLTLTPHPTKHPTFIPFDQHASLCVQESPVEALHSHYCPGPPTKLMTSMTRLKSLHKQFKATPDRRQRLKFLEDVIYSNSSESSDANIGVTARKPRFSVSN